jgi:Flp pilus assembly protein TadG
MRMRWVEAARAALRRLREEERGAALALGGLLMLAMFGACALTFDVGLYLELRRQLQNAADAAAHAGALSMPDTAAAAASATEYFEANAPTFGDSSIAVSFPGGGDDKVHIEVEADVNYVFAHVLGFTNGAVAASAEAGAELLDIVVVLDRSGSMCIETHGVLINCPTSPATWQPFSAVKTAAKTFSGEFSPTYAHIGLVSYSTSATLNRPLGTAFVGPTSLYATSINGLLPAGYTNIGGAIARARQELTSANARPGAQKVIVLLSDGRANVSSGGSICFFGSCTSAANYARTEATTAANAGIDIYTLGLGDDIDPVLMQDIADIGRGSYVYAPDGGAIAATFEQVANMVRVRILQ